MPAPLLPLSLNGDLMVNWADFCLPDLPPDLPVVRHGITIREAAKSKEEKKAVLFIDTGMITPHVEFFAKRGWKVFYYTPWNEVYSRFRRHSIGIGVDGVNKVKDWTEVIDDVDFIIVTDDTFGYLGDFIRSKGYKVISAGKGAVLERNRSESKKILSSLGIKVPPSKSFKGSDEVIKFFRSRLNESSDTSTGKYFLKLDAFRGDMDTINIETEGNIEAFDTICKQRFGPARKFIDFTIEEKVGGNGSVETGADCIFDGKDWVRPMLWGFEIETSYIGKFSDKTPFDDDLEKLRPYLAKIGWSGPFSFEVIYDGKDAYWIDVCARNPYPLSYIYPNAFKDYDKIMRAIAYGETPKAEVVAEYAACCSLTNEEAINRWLAVNYKDGYNPKKHLIELFPIVDVDGQRYITPQEYSVLGAGIGLGKDAESAMEAAIESCDKLNIWFTQYEHNMGADFQKTVDDFNKLSKMKF